MRSSNRHGLGRMWPFLAAVASSLFLQSTLAQIFNSAIKGNVADTLTTLLRTPMDVGYQAYQQLSRGSYTAQQMIDLVQLIQVTDTAKFGSNFQYLACYIALESGGFYFFGHTALVTGSMGWFYSTFNTTDGLCPSSTSTCPVRFTI
jgi:hypothetical protein